jgi:hypothetical protein
MVARAVEWDGLLIHCTPLCVPRVRIPHLPQIGFVVFIIMENTWEYDREKIKFRLVSELIERLNELGKQGWEIIYYEEHKPKKFGDNYETVIIVKRLKKI